MIIKSMSRKSHSFGQVLEYINAPESTGPAILQNLNTNEEDLKAIERAFLDNSRYLPPRKNGNVLYHEILSFSDLDRNRATPAILETSPGSTWSSEHHVLWPTARRITIPTARTCMC